MKKRQVALKVYNHPLGVCTLTVENARCLDAYPERIERVLRAFLDGEELFFGFYRTDGMHLSPQRQRELETEIPAFFRESGEMRKISEHLSVARVRIERSRLCAHSPRSLITILKQRCLCPELDWETFQQFHAGYQGHRLEDMILNHFADLLFCYADSGDFSVCFDPQAHDCEKVRVVLQKVFLGEGFCMGKCAWAMTRQSPKGGRHMLYCTKCQRLTEGEKCPACNRSRALRQPRADDPVLLCTVRYVLAAMIEPLLEEEKIPYAKHTLGSSALLGGVSFLENYAFYVPYAAYAGALELLTGIFAEDEEVRMALREAAGLESGERP